MIAAYKDGDEVEVESEDERQMLPLFEVVQLLFISSSPSPYSLETWIPTPPNHLLRRS